MIWRAFFVFLLISSQAHSKTVSFWNEPEGKASPDFKEHLKTDAKISFQAIEDAHGEGSDKDHNLKLDTFSDKEGSHQTPKGFHKMTKTYYGQHGLSLKMEGLEKHNKNSMKRAIVLHGAKYVSWKHTGRSFGCPSVEKKYTKKIIEQLKGGALFYHFK